MVQRSSKKLSKDILSSVSYREDFQKMSIATPQKVENDYESYNFVPK